MWASRMGEHESYSLSPTLATRAGVKGNYASKQIMTVRIGGRDGIYSRTGTDLEPGARESGRKYGRKFSTKETWPKAIRFE